MVAPAAVNKVAKVQRTLFDHFKKPKPQPLATVRPETELISLPSPPAQVVDVDADTDSPLPTNGTSQHDPIVVDSSPVKPSRALYPIFDTAKQNAAPPSPSKPAHLTRATSVAPFPDKDSQHVRGEFNLASNQQHNFPRRNIARPLSSSLGILLEPTVCRPESTQPPVDKTCLSLPLSHTIHPAIGQFSHPPVDQSASSHLWIDRWRPTTAERVLGNEDSAKYLLEWLRALELHFKDTGNTKRKTGLKRPRVVRAVRRGRKKRRIDSEDEDDWIVDSDDILEPPDLGDSEDEFMPSATVAGQGYSFDRHLTNTIILAGPTGSGKSSAVYACAEELGYEVFEVYPGIGKRNGASVDHLVGEVGKNHLVRSKATARVQPKRQDVFGASEEPHGGNKPSDENTDTQSVRQSLILLEEVDILFREDANFWSSVITLIQDCKRPVILTCNDLSLVPMSELPIQNVLMFKPCPTPLAASYLYALCCAEGLSIEREAIAVLYQSHSQDLRRTIQHLQFWNSPVTWDDHAVNEIQKKSFGHSSASRREHDILSTEAMPTCDDELGYTILYGRPSLSGDTERSFRPRVEFAEMISHQAVSQLTSEGSLILDYLPWIRAMAAIDDIQEMEGSKKQKRTTRNSQMYVRTIPLNPEQRKALVRSSLPKEV